MAKSKKVYSVVSTDVTTDEPVDTQVVGTYRKREDDVTACIDYIMERLVLRPDIRYAFMHDVNHDQKSLIKFLRGWCYATPGMIRKAFSFNMDDWEMPDEIENAVRLFVRDVVEGGVYDMSTDMESEIGCEQFVFEIQENELK